MGERREQAHYERATRLGDRLFLFYSVGRGHSRGDARWSVIDLSRLTWDVLTPHGTKLGLNAIALPVEDDPRPSLLSVAAVDVPIVEVETLDEAMSEARRPPAHSLSTSEAGRLSLYHAKAYSWMLLKRDRDGGAEVVSINDATHAYRTWWASPARTSLYAFALTIDVAALPIEVLGLWWLARGLRE